MRKINRTSNLKSLGRRPSFLPWRRNSTFGPERGPWSPSSSSSPPSPRSFRQHCRQIDPILSLLLTWPLFNGRGQLTWTAPPPPPSTLMWKKKLASRREEVIKLDNEEQQQQQQSKQDPLLSFYSRWSLLFSAAIQQRPPTLTPAVLLWPPS